MEEEKKNDQHLLWVNRDNMSQIQSLVSSLAHYATRRTTARLLRPLFSSNIKGIEEPEFFF